MQTHPSRPRAPAWHGTEQEAADLLLAAKNHCTCDLESGQPLFKMCETHAMVFTDQRALNGLLFARHISLRLRAEEFLGAEIELCDSAFMTALLEN
jgi:hypothetical protein